MSISRTDKMKSKSKVIILRIPGKMLRQFPYEKVKKESSISTPSSSPESPAPISDTQTDPKVDAIDAASDSNATPAPVQDGDTTSENGKKRKAPMPASNKKQLVPPTDGMAKIRGKPGPKKKARLDDGTIDPIGRPSLGAATGHKLGPKANQGAINAGLRALDRSGKQCRKWNRKAFSLKSFTGVSWEVSSWKGNEKQSVTGGMGDINGVSQQGSSEVKQDSDVAMDSINGDQPDTMNISTPAASSPAIAAH